MKLKAADSEAKTLGNAGPAVPSNRYSAVKVAGRALSYTPPPEPVAAGELSADDRRAIALVQELFKQHVDVSALLADLELAERRPAEWVRYDDCYPNTAINWTPLERLRIGLHVAAVAIATAGAASAALSAHAANGEVQRIAMRQQRPA